MHLVNYCRTGGEGASGQRIEACACEICLHKCRLTDDTDDTDQYWDIKQERIDLIEKDLNFGKYGMQVKVLKGLVTRIYADSQELLS